MATKIKWAEIKKAVKKLTPRQKDRLLCDLIGEMLMDDIYDTDKLYNMADLVENVTDLEDLMYLI